ncbi:hypothetical protein [Mycobacterium sp. 29Ha]|uniref:hypothetical protein n=1 Tax=Mycobacterium sp. 29Ha TaxID=2939268 RepID=UPI0029392A8F|nr:hypothetical protein [Mycobacterium sp. 29Ha]MDV3136036.1 hypothetical protein [Mycobacterium sp. 29Ha]
MAKLDPFRSQQARAQLFDEYDAVMRNWPVPVRAWRCPLDFVAPTALTDDELRGIGAPTTVSLGDREVIHATDRMPRSRVPRR